MALQLIFLLALSQLCTTSPILKDDVFKRDELMEEESVMDHITSVNAEVQDVFESDIKLNGDESFVDLRSDGDVDGALLKRRRRRRKKRSAERERAALWPGRTIPYVIDPLMSWATSGILEAIADFHEHTCLKFVERTTEQQYIKFISKSGCWSSVGREYWSTDGQELSLGSGCHNKGIIMHEIMHASGFWHEQSRPDRNEFVEVLWENIQPGEEFNFNKYSHGKIDNMQVPYDMDSVMHYGRKSFSKNDQPTLRSIREPERVLGQRRGFTENDIQKVNALYDCSSKQTEGWSNWSAYSPCSAKSCFKTRQRFCLSTDLTTCPGANSYGVMTEQGKCTEEECNAPIDGHWGRWSAWSSCSETCGLGTQVRTRQCDDPPVSNGGAPCAGNSSMTQHCILVRCGLGEFDTEFEQSLGPWTNAQTDDADWTRTSGNTPSKETGPSGDHTTGKGYYVFFESSSPRVEGNKAQLIIGWQNPTEGRCLKFAYHMYGANTGTLRVLKVDFDTFKKHIIWTLSGDQGNQWNAGEVTIQSDVKYYLALEAERGSGYRGDIALDDVYFKEYACDQAPPTTQPPTSKELPIKDLGCWKSGGERIFPDLLQNLRGNINWTLPIQSAGNIIGNCYQLAKEKGISMFAIEFYGECWGPGAVDSVVDYKKYGSAVECWNGVGASNKISVYEML